MSSDSTRQWTRLSFVLRYVVFVLLGAYFVAVLLVPKRPTWDAVDGLIAAKQYELGKSPSPLAFVRVSETDTTRDVLERVTWWAPGYQLIPLTLRQTGLSWLASLNLTSIAFWSLGMCGWIRVLRLMSSNPLTAWLTLIVWLMSEWSLRMTYDYNAGDLMVWAVVPWLMLFGDFQLSHFGVRGRFQRLFLSVAFGFCCFATYFLKYSGVFVGGAILFYVVARLATRSWTSLEQCAGIVFGAGFASALVFVFRKFHEGPSPASSLFSEFRPFSGVRVFGTPMMAMTDLDNVFRCNSSAFWGNDFYSSVVGLLLLCSVALVFSCLSLRRGQFLLKPQNDLQGVAMVIVLVECMAVATMVALGALVFVDPRITRVSGCLLLPLLLDPIITLSSERQLPFMRTSAIAAFALLLGSATLAVISTAGDLSRKNWDAATESDVCVGVRSSFCSTELRRVIADRVPAESSLYCFPHYVRLWFPEWRIANTQAYNFGPYRIESGPNQRIALLVGEGHAHRIAEATEQFPTVAHWKTEKFGDSNGSWTLMTGVTSETAVEADR